MVRTIAVFARWPEPGRVKTRLSPALPPDLACDLHRAMLADTLAAVRAAGVERAVLWWADPPAGGSDGAFPEAAAMTWATQRGADLGERLEHALDDLLAESGDRKTLVVGSDAPELTGADLRAGFDALASSDLALGPTPDGGFYLVGLSRPAPGLFRGVEWSSERTLAGIQQRAHDLGLTCSTLAPLADVDTAADVARLSGRLLGRPGVAPATASALAQMGLFPEPDPCA